MHTPHHAARTTRRTVLTWAGALLGAIPVAAFPVAPLAIKVWKDPQCGCCKDWIAHMERDGFIVQALDEGNRAARSRLGLPARYGSCHTALIEGYVVEGHVPAADVRRLLTQRPEAMGLAVPGMPVGSPGMDGPAYGGRRDAYQVLLVRKDESAQVFNTYEGTKS